MSSSNRSVEFVSASKGAGKLAAKEKVNAELLGRRCAGFLV